MYTSIMVPLDGSLFSEHALPLALSTARRSHATLHLVRVHVTDPNQANHPAFDPEHDRQYLASIVDRIASNWDGQIKTLLLEGIPTEAIAAYAEAQHIDLVVMTTHGRGAVSRAWLGSVADRLARQLPMPMLLVRPHEGEPADMTNLARIDHILLPLDGTDWSTEIIEHATALGTLTDAKYTLLQILQPIEIYAPAYGLGTYTPIQANIEPWKQEAQQYLDRTATTLRAAGLQVQVEVCIGPTAMTILDYAGDHDVDLIAIETHGRSGAARLLLGSIADKIVRGTGMPVLLYRPQGTATTL